MRLATLWLVLTTLMSTGYPHSLIRGKTGLYTRGDVVRRPIRLPKAWPAQQKLIRGRG
jgi:hypothetical protein